MRRESFVEYLHENYRGRNSGTSLSLSGASDVASRLKRLEATFDFDIDKLVGELPTQLLRERLKAIDTKISETPNHNLTTRTLADLRTAACRYLDFLRWEAMVAEASGWADQARAARK